MVQKAEFLKICQPGEKKKNDGGWFNFVYFSDRYERYG
jgi:hypothetical protein